MAVSTRFAPQAPIKFSELDRITNWAVIIVLTFQVVLTLCSSAGMVTFEEKNEDDLWYTGRDSPHVGYLERRWPDMDWQSDAQGFLPGCATFFCLYCFFIPMSLYVTFDLAKIAWMKFIDWDAEMVHEEEGLGRRGLPRRAPGRAFSYTRVEDTSQASPSTPRRGPWP